MTQNSSQIVFSYNVTFRIYSQNSISLHPAGRFQLQFVSLRSTTISPCTRVAGTPEAFLFRPFRRASHLHFWYLLFPLPFRSGPRSSSPLKRATDILLLIFLLRPSSPPQRATDSLPLSSFFISLAFYHVAFFHPGKLIFTAFFFAAQRCLRRFCMKAGNFLFTYVFFSTIFFSRNDVSGQRFREAEGEASPQSPPAGALLLKKKKKRKKVFRDL